jgi:hypothetical protein
MKIHVYSDGSEGYQYEPGDRVIVKRTIHGGWFDYGPTRAERCTVQRQKPWSRDRPLQWQIDTLEIRYSDDWGNATCAPWHVEPHPDTYAAAVRVLGEP